MKGSNEANGVFTEIYKNVMDNRIFNNLKQQLNEMIEDEVIKLDCSGSKTYKVK
mgnify:CR=1 FL=1